MAGQIRASRARQSIKRAPSQYSLRALLLWVTLACVAFAAMAVGVLVPLLIIAALTLLLDALVILPLYRWTVFGITEIRSGRHVSGVITLGVPALVVAMFVYLLTLWQ